MDEGYFPSRSEMGRPDHLRVDRGSQEQNANTQTNPENALFSHGFFLSLNEMREPDCVNPVEHADFSGMPDQSQPACCLNDCPTELAVPTTITEQLIGEAVTNPLPGPSLRTVHS
jgi:hypothetical protein